MTAFLIVLAVAAEAYLLGSVDTGILVSKYLYHDDVRTHGSGAAGMTNMLRTFGKKAAALTAVGDVLKGVVAVCLGRWLFGHLPAGMVSLGSITMAAAYPVLTLVYSLMRGLPTRDVVVCTVGAAIMGGMVIWMHRSNIQRIRDGKEYRFGQKHKSN